VFRFSTPVVTFKKTQKSFHIHKLLLPQKGWDRRELNPQDGKTLGGSKIRPTSCDPMSEARAPVQARNIGFWARDLRLHALLVKRRGGAPLARCCPAPLCQIPFFAPPKTRHFTGFVRYFKWLTLLATFYLMCKMWLKLLAIYIFGYLLNFVKYLSEKIL